MMSTVNSVRRPVEFFEYPLRGESEEEHDRRDVSTAIAYLFLSLVIWGVIGSCVVIGRYFFGAV